MQLYNKTSLHFYTNKNGNVTMIEIVAIQFLSHRVKAGFIGSDPLWKKNQFKGSELTDNRI